jgi:hypothetical protein
VLIQENGSHFLAVDKVDDPEENRDELARAHSIMPADFVKKMKDNFKERALSRMQMEQQVRTCPRNAVTCYSVSYPSSLRKLGRMWTIVPFVSMP